MDFEQRSASKAKGEKKTEGSETNTDEEKERIRYLRGNEEGGDFLREKGSTKPGQKSGRNLRRVERKKEKTTIHSSSRERKGKARENKHIVGGRNNEGRGRWLWKEVDLEYFFKRKGEK